MWLVLALGCTDDVTLDDAPRDSATADCDGAAPFSLDATATTPSGVTVGFVAAVPAPPDVGDNTWTLSLDDGAGAVGGAAPRVIPWMPLHGHGLVPAEYVGVDAGDGVYDVPLFDLIMPGVWEFSVDLAPVGEAPDAATFTFCAEG
jgi:hypothetical protein